MSEKLTFEEQLKKLEAVVARLEDKEITLDEAIKQYQAGIELSKACYEQLKNAQSLVVEEAE